MKPRLTKAKRIATAKRTEKRAELFAKYDQDIGTLGHWDIGGFGMDWTMVTMAAICQITPESEVLIT